MSKTVKNTTLKDIAQEAGISTAAVSKVLNNHGGASEATQARVRQIAQQLNYTPNFVAKSLKVNRTKTLGLVVSDSSHSFFGAVIKGAQEQAAQLGYNIILANTNRDIENEKEAIKTLIGKRIDGLLLASSRLTRKADIKFLDSLHIPYVFLIRRSEDKKAPFVGNDNIAGSRKIVDYLIKTGSSRIHFLNMDKESTSSADRLKGYIAALKENGIKYDSSLVYNTQPEIDEGRAVVQSILDSGQKMQALFCGCDILSIGAMEAILKSGLRIPEDVRVCGYDDIEFAAYLRRPLTTMHQPKQSIGVKGIENLVSRIEGESDQHNVTVLLSQLVVRQST